MPIRSEMFLAIHEVSLLCAFSVSSVSVVNPIAGVITLIDSIDIPEPVGYFSYSLCNRLLSAYSDEFPSH